MSVLACKAYGIKLGANNDPAVTSATLWSKYFIRWQLYVVLNTERFLAPIQSGSLNEISDVNGRHRHCLYSDLCGHCARAHSRVPARPRWHWAHWCGANDGDRCN